MNVRLQLVAGFVIIALFVLVVFGTVAHRTATTVNMSEELALLYQVTLSQAIQLAGFSEHQLEQLDLIEENPNLIPTNTLYVIVTTEGNRLLHNNSDSNHVPTFHKLLDYVILTANSATGQDKMDGEIYLWARAAIPESTASLVAIHSEHDHNILYSNAVGKRLLITAFIIIWLAVWVALIVSKRIVRKLDEQNAALIHQALFDEVTGLANRHQLMEQVATRIKNDQHFTLLVLDLNNLRDINDTLGHSAGDELITQQAIRLQKAIIDAETIARLSGDAFALILPTVMNIKVEIIAHDIAKAITQPLRLNDLEIVTHPSIGYAGYPHDAQDASILMQRAEVAMYRAKQDHLLVQRYTSDIDPYSLDRLTLMGDLRSAILENQLEAYYQPKIDLATMRTRSVEVLVRWNHPQRGLVPPDDFIYLAEKSNLIDKLTLWVLDASLQQCKHWLEEGTPLAIAVNLSVRNLHDPTLPGHIERLLHKWQIPHDLLKLEITESAIMSDPTTALRTLHQIHNMGVLLSVDDFGTGHSSLTYLKQLPVSEIKIDRSFVMDMMENENDRVIVQSTVELAKNMGFSVVAEGVESREALHYLASLGCNQGQGYYMSRPLPAHEFNRWLASCAWPVAVEA